MRSRARSRSRRLGGQQGQRRPPRRPTQERWSANQHFSGGIGVQRRSARRRQTPRTNLRGCRRNRRVERSVRIASNHLIGPNISLGFCLEDAFGQAHQSMRRCCWARSAESPALRRDAPFLPGERTSSGCLGMSVSCHKETNAPQHGGSSGNAGLQSLGLLDDVAATAQGFGR